MMDERDERPTPDGGAGMDAQPDERGDGLTFEVTDLTTGDSLAHPLAQTPAAQREQPAQRATRLIQVSHAPMRVVVTLDAKALRIGLAAITLLAIVAIVVGAIIPALRSGSLVFAQLSTSTPSAHPTISVRSTAVAAPTPTTAYPTPTIPAPPLGAMPQNCATVATVPSLGAPGIGSAVGKDPIWVDAFDGGATTLSIPGRNNDQFTEYGWQVSVTIVFTNNYAGSATLSGKALSSATPLWFGEIRPYSDPNAIGEAPSTMFTTNAKQDAKNGAGLGGSGEFYQLAMYLPGAGCYSLSATWPSGSWQITFAAGA